ncbi:hypothetical protein LMH87_000799 [Akanthomyces muscarius]|uniref:Uncharacterized protein n=1 Tax=Akanthomyces muscarius TaxID=2231603 RepID=A0A9W8QFR1_AKAMU|nr:hypothetical protein LMH87_000799 [Akanthomyces muscarius]KAJ4155560.1 hypothetical protein LMH87_000799 [Akanthomyces muscarius]
MIIIKNAARTASRSGVGTSRLWAHLISMLVNRLGRARSSGVFGFFGQVYSPACPFLQHGVGPQSTRFAARLGPNLAGQLTDIREDGAACTW